MEQLHAEQAVRRFTVTGVLPDKGKPGMDFSLKSFCQNIYRTGELLGGRYRAGIGGETGVIMPNRLRCKQNYAKVKLELGVSPVCYEEIIAIWRQKHIRTAADIACEMNGNGAAFIYHSAKIENDNITYHDTREIFDHGGVTGYTGDVRSLFEIQNSVAAYYRMLDAFERREPMNETLICEFQGLLTQGTYDTLRYQKGERPGAYKRNDYVTGRNEVGALPEDVPEELAELVSELDGIGPEQALTAAAYFHAKFENIHPFADGNGRAGRLLMNYLLLLWDHPPIIIHEEDRRDYYAALERFDAAQSLEALVEFLRAQTIKTWQDRFERTQKKK